MRHAEAQDSDGEDWLLFGESDDEGTPPDDRNHSKLFSPVGSRTAFT